MRPTLELRQRSAREYQEFCVRDRSVKVGLGSKPCRHAGQMNPRRGAISGIVTDAWTTLAIAHTLIVDRMVNAMTKKKQLDLRRIHHSPLFWVGAVLFLAAIAIYVFSDDLSWRPSAQ
jgi:hypothetical protein